MNRAGIALIAAAALGCAGTGSTPATSATSAPPTTAAAPTASPAPPAQGGAWLDEAAAFGVAAPPQGAMSHAIVGDRLIVALSYTSEAKPFRVLTARKGEPAGESVPPWTCDAGPAELESSGDAAWVHCIDPASDKDPRNHFWHSGDGGRTWSKAGTLGGTIAMGRYAFHGGTLFASGKLDGKASLLHVVTRGPSGAWSAAPAQASADARWRADSIAAVAASEDGKVIAIVGTTKAAGKTTLLLTASLDGGRTLGPTTEAPWQEKWNVLWASVDEGALRFVVEEAGRGYAGVMRVALGSATLPAPVLTKLPQEVDELCAHGRNLAGRTKDHRWLRSGDGGASLSPMPSPRNNDGPQAAMCGRDGVRLGTELFPWPR